MSVQVKEREDSELKVAVASDTSLSADLGFMNKEDLSASSTSANPEIEAAADQLLQRILGVNHDDPESRNDLRNAVDSMASPVEAKMARKSKMLKNRLGPLAKEAEGSPVAKSLIDLKVKVDEINPANYKLLSPGGMGRFFAWIPGVGVTLNKYFTKFQTAGSVIDSIVIQLRDGADQLFRDIEILTGDQVEMRTLTRKLEKAIQAGMLLDDKLSSEIDKMDPESERVKFLQEEVLFPLRQRIGDLQQTLLVNQQGVMSYEVIIRNNRELIRGAKRCENVTIRALEIAAAVAIALCHQKIVLKTINEIDQTTASLLLHNSATLRTQGVEIHKQASQQSIPLETLKKCFQDINSAMEDVSNFKRNALPAMKQSIDEAERLASEAEKSIQKMEKGNRGRPAISLEIDEDDSIEV